MRRRWIWWGWCGDDAEGYMMMKIRRRDNFDDDDNDDNDDGEDDYDNNDSYHINEDNDDDYVDKG